MKLAYSLDDSRRCALLSAWVSFAALLAVQMGFAALLGKFAQYAGQASQRLVLAISGLFYVAASSALPMEIIPKIAIWLASACIFAYFARPASRLLWPARFAWHYAALAMCLVLLWSVMQGWPLPFLGLGSAAAFAATLAWRRALHATNKLTF